MAGVNDGDSLSASSVNLFEETRWQKIQYNTVNINTGIIAGAGNDLFAWDGTATDTSLSTDGGVTWTASNVNIADMTGVGASCVADRTKMIVADHNSANVSISADSGDNWSSASTDPAGVKVTCLSFPTVAVAVCGMDDGTTRDIYFSINAGNDWTVCNPGPTDDVAVISMVDASNGLAIDVGGKIWTTVNGGAGWSDSGQTSAITPSISVQSDMIALTATTYVMVHSSSSTDVIETGNTTSGGTTVFGITNMGTAAMLLVSNLVQTANDNIYFAMFTYGDVDANAESITNVTLFKSEDSGATWNTKVLPNYLTGASTLISDYLSKAQLTESTDNILILSGGARQLITIDESGT